MTIQKLLTERERLLRRLARIETRRALGLARPHAGVPNAWSHHRTMHPTPRCVATYVAAVLRVLPPLAWSDADRGWRKQMLHELHDAYANEDLATLKALKQAARDEPGDGVQQSAVRRKLYLHVSWLVDRVAELRGRG